MRTRSFIALAALILAVSCSDEPTTPSGPTTAAPPDLGVAAAVDDSVLLIVAGDVHANCTNPGHRSKLTAQLVERYPDALVIPLGDNAGQSGTAVEHECYNRSWGRFKGRTYPTIGNHELNLDPVATAYYDYWNGVGVDSGKAGHRARGYYTLEYGGWLILVANSHRNLTSQPAWMTRAIAANARQCTMATWHRPLFTSSAKPANVQVPGKIPGFWQALYNGGADVILNGHVHSYERFGKLRPDGTVDNQQGIREFVAGTGGSGLYDFMTTAKPGSEKRIKTWGILKLTLWPDRYKWEFINLNGAVLDQGSDTCH